MSILLSKTAQKKLQQSELHSQVSVLQLISKLEALNISKLESDPSVRRVTGTTEEIYVMRIGSNLRAFLTKSGTDIILLSIENG